MKDVEGLLCRKVYNRISLFPNHVIFLCLLRQYLKGCTLCISLVRCYRCLQTCALRENLLLFHKAEASAKQKSVRGVHSALHGDLHDLPCDSSAELSMLSVALFISYDLLSGTMYFPLENK